MKKNEILNYFIENKEKEIDTEDLLSVILSYNSKFKIQDSKAKNLLNKYNSLYGLGKANIYDLTMGSDTSIEELLIIKLAIELGKRWLNEAEEPLIETNNSYAVFRYIYPQMKSLKKEVFKVLLLNSQNQIIKNIDAFNGTVTETTAYIRELIELSIKHHAVSFILVHNHPSGLSTPSKGDKVLTRKIVIASEIIKIPLNDHIVIGNEEYFSFLDQGLIKDYRNIANNIMNYQMD